ncbi:YciI family protein [Granulicoccus sp. GXG6511]|uniref:YciI family protein n=1 Tax=Granulicoccus sp. GXG6511 TaxID=3381351 RepID=UPI003D7D65D5
MKYVILLMADGAEKPWADQTPEEQAELMTKFGAFDEACQARAGVEILAGEALGDGDASTTVRHAGGTRTVTDGPYAEAVEGLGGFYLLEAPNLDVVLELLEFLPRYDIQVSPVVDPM